ncbi:hypothetical protein N9V68_00810 [Octadecabacter sp.]|nr:hypothetical protein [Octadecabacter sp.]
MTLRRAFFVAIGLTCSLMSGAARAQETDPYLYVSYIGDRDFFNSSGDRLTDACGIIQQERANYHSLGIRDDTDGDDPIFADRDMRARIPDICVVRADLARDIVTGETRYVGVIVKRGPNGEIYEMMLVYPAG